QLPFGGLNVFLVHETFLTPRILANALVLFALERTLRHRHGQALLCLAPAMLTHPLMAVGGVLIWAGYFVHARLGGRGLAVGIAGLLGTAIGAELPYALLLQGQPYRALWVLKVLQVPLGFSLIRRWAGSASVPRQFASLGLILYFSLTVFMGIEAVLPFFVL